MKPACPLPCSECPWRTSNQGTHHPGGWYTAKNLKRLWAGLRRGESMSCHPTDVNNPLPPGFDEVPEGVQAHECTGGLILQQRELMVLQDPFEAFHMTPVQHYRKTRPFALTAQGIRILVFRAQSGAAAGLLMGRVTMASPDLNTLDIGHAPLGPWAPR